MTPSPKRLTTGARHKRNPSHTVPKAKPMQRALPPGSKIGILGGGQLGQMLSLAASRLGFECHIFDPSWGGPASKVSRFENSKTSPP